MYETPFISEEIAERIEEAGETCLLIVHRVDEIVQEALLERAKHTENKARVVIDGTHHAERSGCGETSTWRELMDATELRKMSGTRLGLLVTDHGAWLFDPRDKEGLSAVVLETHREAAFALVERILGPRDYVKEQEITVYRALVGYIELRLVGTSLATGTRLKIPKALVERGLVENELRARISESVRINLDDKVDTGVRAINERLDAIRTLYTRQLGKPHGRIYRKRHRQELDCHLKDLQDEINRAKTYLGERIEKAVNEELDHLAETYSRQSTWDGPPELIKEDIRKLLQEAWREASAARPRKMRLEVTYKDLTWETLQDEELKKRILKEFPDLKESKLYKDFLAHTSDP